ncbi:hydroxyacylglutathione hydrolase [Sphingomonas xanthus]|uniref:Hydroxyacylglutathione hydrolase n=1 Tax=Sphingomonas xanthus TaxID=2594473 RepID=A0A516IRA5_9SPHN|nr:hydroxyacylglutathione hydrolase [Sphingomonas xanthus]QDP19422.1 hydroxyacylglutathione hydrolase [Sphingomonas xanthus]
MHSSLQIVAVPAFADNYLWLVHDPDSRETAVIDPGDPAPVMAEAGRRGWRIDKIFNTHWHPDHTGGNLAIKAATGADIWGPAGENGRVPGLDHPLGEGDTVQIGAHCAQVMEVPGHTIGHIAYWFAGDKAAFVGDTLFAMGCGRLFEGTPEQMHASLSRLAGLPEDTELYCAHEYTLSNARFAAQAFPDDAAIADRLLAVEQSRIAGQPTVPTNVAIERATNPFLRADNAEHFARLRAAKDDYR